MTNLDSDSRVCWWLLLLFVFAAPFLPLTGIPIAWEVIPLMDWQRMFEAAILLACMAWGLTAAPARLAVDKASLYAWGTALAVGLGSAVLVAEHLQFALLEWSWLLLLIVLAGMLRKWTVVNHDALDKLILLTVLAGSGAYLAWFWVLNAHLYFPFIPSSESTSQQISFPGFANVRYFSDYQSFMLLLLPTALYRFTAKGPLRGAGTLLVGLYFSLAIIVGSRSVIAAHILLHAVLFGFLGNRYRAFLVTQLKFWLYGALFFVFLSMILPLLFAGGESHSAITAAGDLARLDSSKRDVLWQLGWEAIKTHPLLGIGPMHYANLPNPIASHPHNLMIQFAAEWGLPATLILVWLVGRHLYQRVATLPKTPSGDLSGVPLAMACATFALILQSMVTGTFNYPVSQVIGLLCFSYVASGETITAQSERGAGHYWLHVGGWLALAIVIATMTTLESVKARNYCFHYNPWPSPIYATRFWQQGWLVGPCSGGESLLSRSGRITQPSPPSPPHPAQTP